MARTLVASDDFSGTLSAWDQLNPSYAGSITISGGAAQGAATGPISSSWAIICRNSGTYSDDQYSKITIPDGPAAGYNNGQMVAVRCSGDVNTSNGQLDYYCVELLANNAPGSDRRLYMRKYVNGTQSQIGAQHDIVFNVGDTLEIEAEGTTIRCLKNGVVQFSETDSSLTSGRPAAGAASGMSFDNWEGGNVGAAGTDATAPGAVLSGSGTISGGAASGGSGATGSFSFSACENNSHSGILDGVVVNWAWHSGGAVGSATAITNGSGTLTISGMTISGVPTGAGYGVIRTADGTVVGYQEGTVS